MVIEAVATQECLEDKPWWNLWGKGQCIATPSANLESLGYDAHQQSVINQVVAVGDQLGLSDHDIVIALATCLVESQCRTGESVREKDHDSIGPFQQRPSQNWPNSEDPKTQAHAFFEGHGTNEGLLDIPNRDADPGGAAQSVQKSAYPDRYATRMPEAQAILEAIRSGGESDVVAIATDWVGQEFNPGIPAQCAYFVREVYRTAGHDLSVTSRPMDGVMSPMGKGMANSLSGNDLGKRIRNSDKLQPGDIVFFSGTYRPDWVLPGQEESMITHVGIYVGGGMMVDRPTTSQPVQKRSIDTYDFYGAIRPHLN